MGIYYGYSLFRKHGGRIVLRKFSRYKGKTVYGGLSRRGGNYIIEINNHVSWDERVKTYIHELLHLGLELQEDIFSRGPKPGLENTVKKGKVVLGEIDRQMYLILELQPRLVKQLRFDLERDWRKTLKSL